MVFNCLFGLLSRLLVMWCFFSLMSAASIFEGCRSSVTPRSPGPGRRCHSAWSTVDNAKADYVVYC